MSLSEDKDITLLLLVGTWFQVLFHYPSGVLFTFPSRYLFTIGCQRVFSLRRWSSWIPTRFLGSRGTQVPESERFQIFAYGAITHCGVSFQKTSTNLKFFDSLSHSTLAPLRTYNPGSATLLSLTQNRFRLIPFRSPLLGKSHLLSIPQVT